jgi:hypothetical protein
MLLRVFRIQELHKGALRCALVPAVLIDCNSHWGGLSYSAGSSCDRQGELRSGRGRLGIGRARAPAPDGQQREH